jgi:sugar phosphate isomerase/epimerase
MSATIEGAREIDLALHSYSLINHFRLRPGYDIFAYLDDVHAFGFTGVNISLNGPDYRDLGSIAPDHVAAVRRRIAEAGLSLEIDTSGTAPDHLGRLLAVARDLGAASLRTYTRHRGAPAAMAAATREDLKRAAELAEAVGVVVVLENHEDFTGAELAAILAAVDSPWVRALYDYGNPMMLLEDPFAALDEMLPFVHSVHLKDHVLLPPEVTADGQPWVLGVPIGQGNLPIVELTERLVAAGLRRLAFENVWAYRAPLARTQAGPGVVLGRGVFAYALPPYDEACCLPAREDLAARDPERLLVLERTALASGLSWLESALAERGIRLAGRNSRTKEGATR